MARVQLEAPAGLSLFHRARPLTEVLKKDHAS